MPQLLLYLLTGLFALFCPVQPYCQENRLEQFIEPINEITIHDFNEERIEISWPEIEEEDVIYCLYGSEHPEFSIDNAILIKTSLENSLTIETAFPYYYVLASSQGKLSEPSPCIALKDFFCQSKPFARGFLVSPDVWQKVLPYLVPDDHPAKAALDRIFTKTRVTSSLRNMRDAGFINPTLIRRNMIVGKHPDLEGYLLKIFLDNSDRVEWQNWLERIEGAALVRATVDKYGYQDIVKVPHKWIYPLPDLPAPAAGSPYPKSFVLIVEDMELIPMSETKRIYKESVTKSQLKALCDLFYDCKMVDSMLPKNVPFSVDGKISMVDTEKTGRNSVIKYTIWRFGNYLSSQAKAYWEKLCEKKGAKGLDFGDVEALKDLQVDDHSTDGVFFVPKTWERPQGVSEDIWNQVKPYLIPEDHPAKFILDNIFSSSKPLASLDDFKKAGFFKAKLNKKKMLVSGHPRLKGYLIKGYLDEFPEAVWHQWITRVRGARAVQECLDRHQYNNIFKVAKKWIYALPDNTGTATGSGMLPKQFILVVQDLGIVSKEANYYRYGHYIQPFHLNALYTVVMECLLYDSMVIQNIPFCYDNKIGFVDTEWYNIRGTEKKLTLLTHNLSSDMQKYWLKLINQGGPKSYSPQGCIQ